MSEFERGRVRRCAAGGTLMALLAVALVATGCTVSPQPASSPSTAAEPTPSPAPDPPVQQQVACRLTVTISDAAKEQGGAGHSSTALLLRNNGSGSCTVRGYPAVTALDSAGNTVTQAQQTPNGYMGGLMNGQPPTITLAPGQAASALFETLNANRDGTACKPYAVLRVTPPAPQSEPVTIDWGLAGCADPQIHPVVPGDTGRA